MNHNNTNKMLTFSNTYFDKLPRELIDYIWEFNHDGASRIINYYARKCITKSILDIKEMITFAHINANLGIAMQNHKFFYRNRVMDNNQVFSRMKACQCCKRHQILKPNKLEYYVWSRTCCLEDRGCQCICRHYTRWLCRADAVRRLGKN